VSRSHRSRQVKRAIYKLNVQPTSVTSTISVFLGISPPYYVLGETVGRDEDMILLQLGDKLTLGDERFISLVVGNIFERASL